MIRAHKKGSLRPRVKDVMCYDIQIVDPSMTIVEAARKMLMENIGCLPIGTASSLCGIVTDRDLATRGIMGPGDPSTTKVGEIMTHFVITVSANDTLEEALAVLDRNELRRVVVVDADNRPIASLSIDDYFVWSLNNAELEIPTQQKLGPIHA